MTDPNDLRKVETWLRDCKADLWMAECCDDAADDLERLAAMLKMAFHEGFNFTREGFNGECAFDHLSPNGLTLDEMAETTVSGILADHDAVPEAKAKPSDRGPDQSQVGTGNTPTLTDAERAAVEWCVEMATIHATECEDELAALRKLLERLK